MGIRLNGHKFKERVTFELPETEVLVSFRTIEEGQIFQEWLEDRGLKQFKDYVEEIYGIE